MAEQIPHDIEVERSLLGALLSDHDTLVELADTITSMDFYNEKNRTIFDSAMRVAKETSQVDIVSVTNDLRTSGCLEKAGGPAYLSEMIVLPDLISAPHHAEILKDKRIKRDLIAAAQQTLNRCSYDMGSAEDAVADLQKHVFAAAENMQQHGAEHISGPARRVVDHAEVITGDNERALGLRTNIPLMDRAFGYLTPKNIYIVAGGVSAGKSAMVDQIADHVAEQDGKVMIYALEMSVEERAQRFISRRNRIDMGTFKSPMKLREHDMMSRIRQAAEELREPPIYLDDSRSIKTIDIYARARKFKQRFGLDLLVIDYLQLVRPTRRGPREQEVAEMTREVNAIAGELEIPVLLVCQLSRTHQHENRPPELRDLRESGAIEQHAHGVFMIYRPDLHESEAKLYVRKNRNGPIDQGTMMFEGNFCNFREQREEDFYAQGHYG
jgi:replicative DNA helicase